MPDNPSINFIAVLLLLIGLFLFIAGLKIFQVEKVTVSPGIKTWGIGLVLIAASVFLLFNPKLFENKQKKSSSDMQVKNNHKPKASLLKEVLSQANEQPMAIEKKHNQLVPKESRASLLQYYDLLNHGDVSKAWNFLSENIQLKLFKRMSKYPIESYETWWLKEVHSTEVVSLQYLDGYPTKTDAKIEARLIYVLDGRVECSDDHSIIHLKWLESNWLMFDKNRISERKDIRNCL